MYMPTLEELSWVAAIVGTIATIMAFIYSLWTGKKADDNLADNLIFSYARLFGAFQVQFFLKAENSKSKYLDDKSKYDCDLLKLFSDADKAKKFYNSWKHKDAYPVMTTTWREYFNDEGGGQSAYDLLAFANSEDEIGNSYAKYLNDDKVFEKIFEYYRVVKHYSKTRLEQLDFYCSQDSFEAYLKAIGIQIPYEKVEERIKKNSNKIGFLVLYIKNVSDSILLNISIDSKTVYGFNVNSTGKAADVDIAIENMIENETTLIPYIEPKQTIMLLLSIYKKDKNGYPDIYLSSVVQPVKITYNIKGKKKLFKQQIRGAFKDKAARFYMPFGWFNQ